MGTKNRERIERIKMGLEKPFRNNAERMVANDVIPDIRESDVKVKEVIKTKCPSITNVTEIKTCRQIMGMLGNSKIPQRLINDSTVKGMRKVVDKLKKFGETGDSIFNFYWGIEEFRELWGKLGYQESDWKAIAEG